MADTQHILNDVWSDSDNALKLIGVAGSALIGKVGIDQTTPGTTDSVSVATAQGAGATIGVTTGAKVITDANGTLQQYLRGVIHILATNFFSAANSFGANLRNASGV